MDPLKLPEQALPAPTIVTLDTFLNNIKEKHNKINTIILNGYIDYIFDEAIENYAWKIATDICDASISGTNLCTIFFYREIKEQNKFRDLIKHYHSIIENQYKFRFGEHLIMPSYYCIHVNKEIYNKIDIEYPYIDIGIRDKNKYISMYDIVESLGGLYNNENSTILYVEREKIEGCFLLNQSMSYYNYYDDYFYNNDTK